jgi:hypothetical protein
VKLLLKRMFVCVSAGDADIAVSGADARRVTVLLGNASSPFTAILGRFSRTRRIDVGVVAAPAGPAAGDINDDGVTDVALLGDSDTVSVFIGDGAGGLVPMTHCDEATNLPPKEPEKKSRRAGPFGPADIAGSEKTRPTEDDFFTRSKAGLWALGVGSCGKGATEAI